MQPATAEDNNIVILLATYLGTRHLIDNLHIGLN
ncbi:hypothetical protein C3B55_00380 [Candidatus Pseudomonas adelgestsugas]|uniref:Pantoate--beta-alanine ligase n=1 Tax=Candidatus Pseudomonas adelgestsugas TaxID=1302376 RepID=A0ABX5R7V9_9PSED|nr:hypothetical protein C3B55_00380 [Candidatus Pseudomonas adelgestsugas]